MKTERTSSFKVMVSLWFIAVLLSASTSFAYQVWIGTSCTPKNAALQPETWSLTAQSVQGLNLNLAPCLPTPGTPCEDEVSCTKADWKVVIAQYVRNDAVMVPIPRSAFDSVPHPDTTLEQVLVSKFDNAVEMGYGIGRIMIYDNRTGDPPVLYTWTVAEAQQIRDWLDANGHADVRLVWDARNNAQSTRNWCMNPLIDDVLLEAGPEGWYSNAGSRQELLTYLWANLPTTKKLIFQLPLNGMLPYGSPSGFQHVRRFVIWLGADMMNWAFVRSSRVVILPVTYNGTTFTFYPETAAPNLYTNTLTSLALSLIEQRDLFERRTRIPTQADADSYVRSVN